MKGYMGEFGSQGDHAEEISWPKIAARNSRSLGFSPWRLRMDIYSDPTQII
jgi:hypothetical protein